MDTAPRHATGRPRAASSSHVAALALRMFQSNGYDETSMQQIATAAGISRPTLFRYFRSKAEIVWDRYDEEATELRRVLAESDAALSPLEVLCDILPRLLNYDDGELDLLRTQVGIIAAVPAVQGLAQERTAEWVQIMADYIAERAGSSADDLLPTVMSRCIWSAGWTALTYWAAGDEERPDRALDEAFTALREGFSLETLRGGSGGTV